MVQTIFQPFPELETERLILRRPLPSDAEEMFRYRSDPQLMRYIPHRLAGKLEEVQETLVTVNNLIDTGKGLNWALTLKDDPTIIGMAGYVRIIEDHYRAEVGYMLHTPHHGKGLVSEAVRAILDFGYREMKLHSVEAVVNTENEASKRVLERMGFSKDALFRDYLCHAGRFSDAHVYSILLPLSAL